MILIRRFRLLIQYVPENIEAVSQNDENLAFEFYLMPCISLLCGNHKLCHSALELLNSFMMDDNSLFPSRFDVSYSAEPSRRVHAAASIVLFLCGEMRLQRALRSSKSVIKTILQNMQNLLVSSKNRGMSFSLLLWHQFLVGLFVYMPLDICEIAQMLLQSWYVCPWHVWHMPGEGYLYEKFVCVNTRVFASVPWRGPPNSCMQKLTLAGVIVLNFTYLQRYAYCVVNYIFNGFWMNGLVDAVQ